MTTNPPLEPTGSMARPPLRPHVIAGIASVLVSGLGSVTWLIVSLTVFFTGLGLLPAALSGLLLLVPWVIVMRWVAEFERRRARAVHGVDAVRPARRVSTRGGFLGYLHTIGLDVISWQFWRSVLHHHLVMVVAFFPTLIVYVGLWVAYVAFASALVNPQLNLGDWTPGTPLLIIGGVVVAAIAVGTLIGGVFAERGLARVMLPSTDDDLREEVEELVVRRQGAVDAAEQERLRIERDLHDGVQPRLVALAMTLGMARTKIESDPQRAGELVGEAHDESKAIITELRQLARGIHPAVLTDRGLDAALSALAARSPVPVDLQVDVPSRLGREQEAVAYFVVSEALTNIAKHSRADHAAVHVRVLGPDSADGPQGPGSLLLRIEDDGGGGASVHRDGVSTGLAGLTDRVRATGGRLEISSPRGGPTVLDARIPVTARAASPSPAEPQAPQAPQTEEQNR